MKTFSNLQKLITAGKIPAENILTMMDVFLMAERITADEYTILLGMINDKE